MTLLNHFFKCVCNLTMKRKFLESCSRNRTLPNVFAKRKFSTGDASEEVPYPTFKADEMEITILPDEELQKKPDKESLNVLRHFTDYMFCVRWDDENGWSTPKIDPISNFRIHPASKCLNYGVQVIEGLKAYRGHDGNVRLFRPDIIINRLLSGSKRLSLPSFDPNELIECIKRLVKLEMQWISEEEGSCVYIRPVLVGTDACLNVTASKTALLYVLLCPGAESDSKPISLYADANYAKSWPGGTGDVKIGGNYAVPIYVERLANQQGCDQVLWLQGKDLQITDISNMNVFFVIRRKSGERELVTPPLNGLILNGVVRQSVLELCSEWEEVSVHEEIITFSEFQRLLDEKKLREMFGSGTFDIIKPVGSVLYEGSKFDIPTVRQDQPIYQRIRKALTDIYYGKIDHDWAVRVDN